MKAIRIPVFVLAVLLVLLVILAVGAAGFRDPLYRNPAQRAGHRAARLFHPGCTHPVLRLFDDPHG